MNTRKLRSYCVAGAIMAAMLGGCQTAPKVQAEFDQTAGFTAAKTFAVLPLPARIEGVDPGLILRVGPAAMNAVRAALTGKGYTEVAKAANADLAVLVHGKSVPKTEITDWGFTPYAGRVGWYRGYAYGASNISVNQYTEGTLIVEVYDVRTKQNIWVGWVSGTATEDKSKQAANVTEQVTRILAEYPAVGMAPVTPLAK